MLIYFTFSQFVKLKKGSQETCRSSLLIFYLLATWIHDLMKSGFNSCPECPGYLGASIFATSALSLPWITENVHHLWCSATAILLKCSVLCRFYLLVFVLLQSVCLFFHFFPRLSLIISFTLHNEAVLQKFKSTIS